MSLHEAAKTFAHYIRCACRDMSPDMLRELDDAVEAFKGADAALGRLSIHTIMTGAPLSPTVILDTASQEKKDE